MFCIISRRQTENEPVDLQSGVPETARGGRGHQKAEEGGEGESRTCRRSNQLSVDLSVLHISYYLLSLKHDPYNMKKGKNNKVIILTITAYG